VALLQNGLQSLFGHFFLSLSRFQQLRMLTHNLACFFQILQVFQHKAAPFFGRKRLQLRNVADIQAVNPQLKAL
jgi:hypothetical protein